MRWPFRRSNAVLAKQVPEGGLRRFLETPQPPRETKLKELPLLALDFETTGLEVATDHIISAGMVDVEGLTVPLGTMTGFLVDAGQGVGQSAVIHRLTDDQLKSAGISPDEALERVFDRLAGRVLLAHCTDVEVGFLQAAVQRRYGIKIDIPAVDTMALGLRALNVEEPPPGSLRLWKLRARAGLPSYVGHDAAVDALACAELYLALSQELAPKDLGTLLRWS